MGTIKKNDENDENGQLSCGIYSSPAAARSPLQGWVGDRCCDRSIPSTNWVLFLISQWHLKISFKLVYRGQIYRILEKKYV